MGVTADTLVRGHQFDGETGHKTGADLEDLVCRATLTAASELVDQDTLETYLDEVLNIYRARIKDGSVTAAKLAPGALLPAGAVVAFGMGAAPTGWLVCDGAAVSRATYATLFAAIGTTYGAGNGSTTFNLPDMKGRVIAGLDAGQTEFDAQGETGGAKTHVLVAAEMPAHTHSIDVRGDGSGTPTVGPGWSGNVYAGILTGSAGSGVAHNNLQPYMVMTYCIKT